MRGREWYIGNGKWKMKMENEHVEGIHLRHDVRHTHIRYIYIYIYIYI